MIVFQQILFVLNVLLTCVFGVGYFVAESPKVAPKAKAKTGVLLASLFFAFLLLLVLFAISSAVLKQNALYLALSTYAVIPFAIGRLVSYRTLGFYTVLQLLALILSAATLCVV